MDTLTEFKQRFTFVGLNYKVLGADGTGVSAGRFSYTFDVTLDEEGHIIDESFKESQTPHLLHLFGSSTEAAICETLAQ